MDEFFYFDNEEHDFTILMSYIFYMSFRAAAGTNPGQRCIKKDNHGAAADYFIVVVLQSPWDLQFKAAILEWETNFDLKSMQIRWQTFTLDFIFWLE